MKNTSELIKEIQEVTESKLISLIYPPELGIEQRDVDELYEAVKEIEVKERITLILFSYGGDVDAAYKMVLVLRAFCKELFVIVPSEAKSAATLLCLGADKILMGPVSELGPLDPLVTHPMLNVFVPARSVTEFMKMYVDLARVSGMRELPLIPLDPLHVGFCRLAMEAGREYTRILLTEYSMKGKPEDIINKTVERLTTWYKGHSFVIDFKEASKIGLNVEKMPDELHDIIWELYRKYMRELEEAKESEILQVIIETERGKRTIVKKKPRTILF